MHAALMESSFSSYSRKRIIKINDVNQITHTCISREKKKRFLTWFDDQFDPYINGVHQHSTIHYKRNEKECNDKALKKPLNCNFTH